jgi:hypothetical protein
MYNSRHPAPRVQPVSALRELSVLNFDFVWKGNLNAAGVMEEGGKRVGIGFRDMMRALGGGGGGGGEECGGGGWGAALDAALLDVQVQSVLRAVWFKSGGSYARFDGRFTGIICLV